MRKSRNPRLGLALGGGSARGWAHLGVIRAAAVATALHTGTEVWLREGSTIEAVRASIALPALVTPVMRDGQMLVDGGLVNLVPVSLARAMGADIVIAVDLSADILGRHLRDELEANAAVDEMGEWKRKLHDKLGALLPGRTEVEVH